MNIIKLMAKKAIKADYGCFFITVIRIQTNKLMLNIHRIGFYFMVVDTIIFINKFQTYISTHLLLIITAVRI